MSSASIKKIIPCKKNQLIEMVLDIEKYPEFVPWCLNGKVHTRKESSDLVEIKADLKVGKSIINETYTSLVHYYKEKDKILVDTIKWNGNAKKAGIEMGDYITEFKIENSNRPNKKIVYPIALFLLLVFGYLNKRRTN